MLPVSLEDVQGHDPRGTVRALLALNVMSIAEHEVALWEGRIVFYGCRGCAKPSAWAKMHNREECGNWDLRAPLSATVSHHIVPSAL